MERLLLVLIFCYSHLLFVVRSSDSGDGLPCAPSAMCANLDTVSFPFGVAPDCGASPSFLLSSCDTHQAYWDNFKEAIGKGSRTISSPAVMGLSYSYSPATEMAGNNNGGYGFVNLTWNSNLLDQTREAPHSCSLAHHGNESVYLPDAINLKAFASSVFRFSSLNVYLLFNCTNIASLSQSVKENTPTCQSFQKQCGNRTSCFQLTPIKELKLHHVMETLACAQFMFFVTSLDPSFNVGTWSPGVVQLNWTESQVQFDSKCANCEKTYGTCGYNVVDGHDKFKCFCPGNRNSSTDCEHVDYGQCNGRLCSTASIIGLGVAVSVVAMAILVGLALWCLRRRRSKSSTRSDPTSSSSNKFWTQRALVLSAKFGPLPTKEFSHEELLEATESFADENMIGHGGFGAVYVGFLRDGRKVAIKRLYHDNFRRMEQFYNEMQILSNLQHPNLVKLYGFCCQDNMDLLLVFEYASKGTVSDQLHDVNKPAVSWKVRLNIAWETAVALSYLHNSVSPPIFHRDVKTTNILLDEDFHVKLGDFGLSRLVPLKVTHVTTAPQGTPGYLDPDYHQSYQLTDKSDVYSFGVVLMELVSGMLAVDMSRNRREINLSSLALMKIACGVWQELVDPRLEMDKNPDVERMVKGVVELAFQCLQAEKDDRPSMNLVAETLANLRRESGYEYEEVIDAQYPKVGIPSPEDETSQLTKPKYTFSTAYYA